MAKYTVEEILREYAPEGRQNGSVRTRQRQTPRATTLQRPDPPAQEPEQAPQEDLVDIRHTISAIKSRKARQAREQEKAPAILRERFPTQHLQRDRVSYIRADKQHFSATNSAEYDSAVKLAAPASAGETILRPSIRPMEDSTRAKDKRKRRRRTVAASYEKDSITGTFRTPTVPAAAAIPREEEAGAIFEGEPEETISLHARRTRRQNDMGAKTMPDNFEQLNQTLRSLQTIVAVRSVALLVLCILGAVLAFAEEGLAVTLTPRGFAVTELVLGAVGVAIAFPTVRGGLWHFLRFHADSDSFAAVPTAVSLLGALLAVINPEMLANEAIHLYIPCALLALFCNALGRVFVVRRAVRNCRVLSKDTKKRILSYVSQEDVAELLTHGMIHDVPIVAAVRYADGLCDILRYTYSSDLADNMSRKAVPGVFFFSLVCAVFFSTVRGTAWLGTLFSIWALFLTAGCCVAAGLACNLPLEWESKKTAAAGSAMLGYQSADDFFDVNTLLAEASDLFPPGSVQIAHMKILGGAKVDQVLLDAASLVHCAGSILRDAFSAIVPDQKALRQVDDFVCEEELGLCGWIANRRVLFGSYDMMASHNIEGLPAKSREAQLLPGGEVLYLSISGVLSGMFSVQIMADRAVLRQMRMLKQENICLAIRSIDHLVTLRRLHDMFDFPIENMKILPSSMHHLFEREVEPLRCASASMVVGESGFGSGLLLLAARRVRRASIVGVVGLVVSLLLGLSLALLHVFTGAYETMTAQFFLIYHCILTVATILAVRVQ